MRHDLGRFLRELANRIDPPPKFTVKWQEVPTSSSTNGEVKIRYRSHPS